MIALVGRLMLPFSWALAVAFWAKGLAEVGGGFAAGAVAGLGAVAQYVCLGRRESRRRVGARHALTFVALGLLLVLATAWAPLLVGMPPMSHWPPPGVEVTRLGVLELHSAALFDLGIALLVYGALVAAFDRVFPPLEDERPWIS